MIGKITECESNVSSVGLISLLNCPMDLVALILSGREFHSEAPQKLKLKLRYVTSAVTRFLSSSTKRRVHKAGDTASDCKCRLLAIAENRQVCPLLR